MDEPSLILGAKHRKNRHDPNVTPDEAKAIFGEGADNACLDHIRLDELESRNKIKTSGLPDAGDDEVLSVLPVVRFTIQSPTGAWHFQSEAVSFNKDGKKIYCFRSSSLLQKHVQNKAVEEDDEDEELLDDLDNPEGEP
jgi:hypothetical protein